MGKNRRGGGREKQDHRPPQDEDDDTRTLKPPHNQDQNLDAPSVPCTPQAHSIDEEGNGQQEKQQEEIIALEASESRKGEDDDVLSRLEELQLGVEEPKLSDDQLRIDDQAQEDELLAMESIYGDNFFIFERQRGRRSFQIHIHIEAPGEIAVTTKFNSSSDLKTRSDGSNEFSYSFKAQHLPSIMLTCLLPKSYPSHLPPYFTISVQWLHSSKISHLCSELAQYGENNQGRRLCTNGWNGYKILRFRILVLIKK